MPVMQWLDQLSTDPHQPTIQHPASLHRRVLHPILPDGSPCIDPSDRYHSHSLTRANPTPPTARVLMTVTRSKGRVTTPGECMTHATVG
jgi:hypothetical protein